jgi:hypothetical protein
MDTSVYPTAGDKQGTLSPAGDKFDKPYLFFCRSNFVYISYSCT